MPSARNDPYKRKAAQALNHLAAAVLDVNEIYQAFDAQRAMLERQVNESGDELTQANLERYTQYTKYLEQTMKGAFVIRQYVVEFIGAVWDLDDETIRVYMG